MMALTRMTIARASDAELADLLATDYLSDDDREAIQDEIEAREDYRAEHADTPSLQDNGQELGSYGS